MNLPGGLSFRDLSTLPDHRAVRWVILLTAAFFLLFAQANQSRIYGDAIFREEQRMSAMQEILNKRLVPHSPVPVITLASTNNSRGRWADEGRCRFFFGRDARPTTIAEAQQAAVRGRLTFIVARANYAAVANELQLNPLIETSFWVLAELGAGNDMMLASASK